LFKFALTARRLWGARRALQVLDSERVYFEDARTFFRHITPRRFDLLEELHRCGPISINALAKILQRNYKNVHDDVKALESIGLVERGEDGRYSVPWDEINTSFKLAV